MPRDWEHPVVNGRHQPLYDEYYEDAYNEWDERRKKWIGGEDPDADHYGEPKTNAGFIGWTGAAPNPVYYRHVKWTPEEACCYQIYQNVSEGTPISPKFNTLEEMEAWLISEGYSPESAKAFCQLGHAPSFAITPAGIASDIHSLDLMSPPRSNKDGTTE